MLGEYAVVLETMDRVQQLFDERPDIIADVIPATALAHFSACRRRLHAHLVAQEASARGVLVDSQTKRELRKRVVFLMRRILLCARARALTSPKLLPIARGKRVRGLMALVQSAHGLAKAATEQRQAFIDGGLRPDFIAELEAAAIALEAANTAKGSKTGDRIAATAGLRHEAINARRELDLIGTYIRERWPDPSVLAAWFAASRIEPRRQRRLAAGAGSRAIAGTTQMRALPAGPRGDESPVPETRDDARASDASPSPQSAP